MSESDLSSPPEEGAGLFGSQLDAEHDEVIIIGVPWEPTASYGRGTSKAPFALVPASHQLDFFDLAQRREFGKQVGMLPVKDTWQTLNREALKRVEAMRKGKLNPQLAELARNQINRASAMLNDELEHETRKWLNKGKLVGILGGDHSSPMGAMKAIFQEHPGCGILHIDAHHDLRQAYEGFTWSHASIMYNALRELNPAALVSVGIRDFCQEEYDLANNDSRIHTFYDQEVKDALYRGRSWSELCDAILRKLPDKVYVSFDIDGLDPGLCPHTGTPVPGGLDFSQACFLLDSLVQSGRQIIGFDLCEVAGNPACEEDEWDFNVGARILYRLCAVAAASQPKT